ncbi:hypothetical protein [Streptomyces sp. SLBN-134]|uniref:hypothetical protein n=1 Tax=Streptomyces sp. SLBN-134 TaxID=2768456 RepID=UPI0037DA41AA
MCSRRAVSALTAASTSVAAVVTSSGAFGRRPSRSREWPASPPCATRWNCGGTASGIASHGSWTSSGREVRTP